MRLCNNLTSSMETFVFLTGVVMMRKLVKGNEFFKMTDETKEHNVILLDSVQKKQTLVECLLIGSRTSMVTMVGYEGSTSSCLMYKEGDGGIHLSHNFDYYIKNKIIDKKWHTSTTVTPIIAFTPAPECKNAYKTGYDCSITKDPQTVLNEKCQSYNSKKYIAVYSNIKGTYRWRCHAASTLTRNHLFYTDGTDYDESMHGELKTLIDDHPDYKTATFALSASGQSCDDICIEKKKRCLNKPKTLNSIYFFAKAGYDCHLIDTTNNGASYWKIGKEPLIRSDSYCTGFVNVEAFDCRAIPEKNERRACQCY